MSDVRAIAAEETHELRRRVLRPHQSIAQMVYPGDDAPDARHFGAFLDGALVGIASIYREDDVEASGQARAGGFRLRGMATLDEVRGRGFGAALLRACLEHAARSGAHYVWCNARTTASGFYEVLGFKPIGAVFELAGIGPHVRMRREISDEASA